MGKLTFVGGGADTPKVVVQVTITGTGDAAYCYVIINNMTITSAASGIGVLSGDVISFAVGSRWAAPGLLTIDGVKTEGSHSSEALEQIDWVVPFGISNVAIALDVGNGFADITVTTS